jgi:hypothetical protein
VPRTCRRSTPTDELKREINGEIKQAHRKDTKELVPHGRTHRLSVVLAGMLQYAARVAEPARKDEEDKSSLVSSLIQATEGGDPSEVAELLHDAVVQLFKDAKVPFERTSARGTRYSIAEEAYAEFIHWYDMPWE